MRRGRRFPRSPPARAALLRPHAQGSRAHRQLDEGAAVPGPRHADPGRARLGPGDYFGEIALISEGSRTATITAETPIKAWGMTMWDFRPLVEGNAEISWKMLQAMAKQLHAAESRAAGAA